MANSNDSTARTLGVALILCLVCSVVVASAAVLLKPLQQKNKLLDKQKNILSVANLLNQGKSVDALFAEYVEAKVVDLKTGEYVDTVDPNTFDPRKQAKDPAHNIHLTPAQDIANIKNTPAQTVVYLIRNAQGELTNIILPISGYGLWSTLHGFLALEADLHTIYGISFYEHAETPGLGGEVDNPTWKALWRGKQAFDANNQPAIRVIKGTVDAQTSDATHKVDGLAGATITSLGVSNLVKFWLGEQGFGPYLHRLKNAQAIPTTAAINTQEQIL
ncbi:MAG: Na(+)-translocating NADH-quinone reductase subunit C [Gammaproteobacteria bacterium]|nr:Na(+)-translocating NADH-quinone reductase subunit C [Gammaproteobacteria bacterium]